jgi:hypothetical protein
MSESCCDLSGCPCDISGCATSPESCEPSCCAQDISGSILPSEDSVETSEQALVETTWGLRLRSRIDQLSSDLSGALVPIPAAPQLHLTDIYIQSMVYVFRFLTVSAQFLQFLWVLFGNVGRGVKRSFQDDIYVFFKGSSYPYYINDVQLNRSGMPEIEWYYNAATNTFLTSRLYTNSQSYHTHHIPFLTAEVKYNDLTLYDVSEFMNSVRWAGEDGEPMPDVNILMSAWSLSSGIVLKRSDQMNLVVINTDGIETNVPLRNQA